LRLDVCIPLISSSLTCAFAAGVLALGRAEEAAVEVLLPELGEPHVPAVVLQRESGEVLVEPWSGQMKNEETRDIHQLNVLSTRGEPAWWWWWERGVGGPREAGFHAFSPLGRELL